MIHSTDSLDFIEDLLSTESRTYGNENILAVADFSYALMSPIEPCLHRTNIERYSNLFLSIIGSVQQECSDMAVNAALNTRHKELINNDIPDVVNRYVSNGGNFVVCSRALSSSNDIDIIHNVLDHHSITLRNRFYTADHCEFSEFNRYLAHRPCYDRSLLVTNRERKEVFLGAFLKRCAALPKTIIFIDDRRDSILELAKVAESFGKIKFDLVIYKDKKRAQPPCISKERFERFWRVRMRSHEEEPAYKMCSFA